MANNPWVLPDGFDADVKKAIKALKSALNKSGATIPDAAFTQLRLGNIEGFLAFVDWDKIRGGMEGFEAVLIDAAQKAGTSTFTLGGVDAELLFDLIDERAVLYAQERVGQLIVEISEQMRETVRQTIASAERGEMTYQMAALQLQNTIPLTTRDAGAVTKFTEKQFQRFMREGLSEARARVKAQNMAAQYAAKLLEARTKTIARTEIIDASMSGRYLGWEAGVTAGYISNDSVKEWIAEPDACPICKELDGKLIGWNQEWEFPEGVTAGSTNRMPPAHPNCRCSVVILPPDYADDVFTPQSGGEMPEEASEFLKHMLGQHDQSTHARREVAGVPKNVDLDGKRWNADARREFGARFMTYENAKEEAWQKLVSERHNGKTWQELDYSEKAQARGYWDEAKQDPAVLGAKKHLTEHFIYAEAAALSATDGGLIGDLGFETAYTPLEKLTRLGGSRDRGDDDDYWKKHGDQELLKLTSDPNAKIYPDPNVGFDVSGVNSRLTRQEALDIANNDWNEFVESSDVQVIMSASAAQKVLTSGRIKTIHDVDRPARAGGSDADYRDTRKVYENVAFGYDDSTPVDKRPVSGLLGSGEPYSEMLDIYGGKNPAVITLKPTIRERTTYTRDDSLNGFETPKPLGNPTSRNWDYYAATAGVYRSATGRNYFTDRKIMAPEAQIHGGVTIEDIAEITFYGNPSASVISTVERKGIPYKIETPTRTGGLTND
jgi:hypothetical protein